MIDMSRSVTIAAVGGVLALATGTNGSDPYDVLLFNPRVSNAILSNPFIVPGEYLDFLRMKIDQLETGQTESWNDYRHPQPHTDREIAEVILQKVALSLYIDVNELVPWKLLDYDDDNLRVVLGDAFSEKSTAPYWENLILFNLNPLVPFDYARKLRTLYPDHPINSAKDLLDLTIIKMRDDGWVHRGSNFSHADRCAEIGFPGFMDFECAALAKKGTSGLTPVFIYAVLHAQNIPSREVFWFAHGGIEFPSLGLGMDGDGVYYALNAGLRLRPNFLPVDITYLELPLFEKWMAMERCEGLALEARRNALEYLNLLDDPMWNADILAGYCDRSETYPQPGDLLRVIVNDGQLAASSCQNDDPQGENYQTPALTDGELEAWSTAIAALATDCVACSVDADCDDGDWCNGEEICDAYGFCAPVLVRVPAICDDGMPCTTARCADIACREYCGINLSFCGSIYVRDTPVCDDGIVCTYDTCVDSACAFSPAVYGDVNADEVVDLTDILCVLDGFTGQLQTCGLESLDIGNCTPDGKIDLADILAVLDGFQGLDPCCGN